MTTQTARSGRRKRETEPTASDSATRILRELSIHESSVHRLLKLSDALEKRGLLEPAIGLLEDEEIFAKVMVLVSSDNALQVIQKAKAIIVLLSVLDYDALAELAQTAKSSKQFSAGAASVIRLLDTLESKGLIEPLVGLLNDEDTFAMIAKAVSSDASLSLLSNLQILDQLTTVIDAEFVDALSKSVSALKKDVKPVKGLFGVIGQLSDPAVAMGLGKVFAVLRALGEANIKKKD
jgi:uncharacterized protein YjgD (DUF1641 family)